MLDPDGGTARARVRRVTQAAGVARRRRERCAGGGRQGDRQDDRDQRRHRPARLQRRHLATRCNHAVGIVLCAARRLGARPRGGATAPSRSGRRGDRAERERERCRGSDDSSGQGTHAHDTSLTPPSPPRIPGCYQPRSFRFRITRAMRSITVGASASAGVVWSPRRSEVARTSKLTPPSVRRPR